ncbi:MAG: DoxX family protein [Planctomycetota bacterium]
MSFRERLAMHVAPLPLRLVLCATFMWAGFGKVLSDMPVQGEQAAILANLGVDIPPPLTPSAFVQDGTTSDDQDETVPAIDRIPPPETPVAEDEQVATPPGATPAPTTPRFTARDFPEPSNVAKLHGLVLLMHAAANPEPFDDGSARPRIWPAWAADGPLVVILAYLAAYGEIGLGFAILVGFLSRVSALGLFSIMMVATWLTELGPAIQDGTAVLGFLPDYPAHDVAAWTRLFWQFALLAASGSLFLLGPGAASIDRLLFEPKKDGKKSDDDDDEDWDEEDE